MYYKGGALKRYSLKSLFYSAIFKALIIPLILALSLLFVIHIFQIMAIVAIEKEQRVEAFKHDAINRIDTQARAIEMIMDSVETNLFSIQSQVHAYYSRETDKVVFKDKAYRFQKNEEGFYFKPDTLSGSSVMFMPQTTPSDQDIIDALNLESIDPIFMPFVDKNDYIVAAWIILENYLVRYYPHLDMKNIFEPTMDIKTFNFYYEADSQYNPQKKNIWTTPYLDPAMKGWLISRVAPIYKKDTFIGAFGIDVNIEKLIQKLPKVENDIYNTEIFISNVKGDILSISEELKLFFDFKQEHDNGAKSLSNELKQSQKLCLLNAENERLYSQIKPLFLKDKYVKLQYKNEVFYLYSATIKNTQWKIFNLINEKNLLKQLEVIEKENIKEAVISVVVFLFFLFVILFNLNRKIRKNIEMVVLPIERLNDATKDISLLKPNDDEPIEELNNLHNNFYQMSQQSIQHDKILNEKIAQRTSELNEKMKTIEELHVKLIHQNIHDPLTNLFNRRYGKEVLERESKKALAEDEALSVAMVDIDHFKLVNDKYGHQVGDEVLIQLSAIIKSVIRHRDVAIRYGGEEFLLIFPNQIKDEISKKIECIASEYHEMIVSMKGIEHGLTLSAGIASLPEDSKDINEVLYMADRALYDSKENGRNQISIYNSN
jgi:diguanylate cyclase (GGDEF)-like protein